MEIAPETTLTIIAVLSWALIVMGLLKLVIWLVGEIAPGAYAKIKSEKARKFMTGSGNRLLFGLGGFVTAALGAVFLAIGRVFAHLFAASGAM